jgi:hypothetical protein
MRTFLLPLTASLFLLSSTVFGEEVKDVGLICERKVESNIPIHMGIWFTKNGQLDWFVRDENDENSNGDTVEFRISEALKNYSSYVVTDDQIIIERIDQYGSVSKDWKTVIDRFTLILEDTFFGVKTTSLCVVFSEPTAFIQHLKKISDQTKKILNKRKI